MPDREKVLTWLEICGKNNDCSGCCPYSENGFGEYGQCRESLMADAYALLKEQEAVEPEKDITRKDYMPKKGSWIRYGEPPEYVIECSRCGQKYFCHAMQTLANYCSMCGTKMESWIVENQAEMT